MRSADVDKFWAPDPLNPSLQGLLQHRLRDGARPGLRGGKSSSRHLIVGIHAPSAAATAAQRAQALPGLLRERLTRIDELTGTIDQLRATNQKLNLENHCLTAMLTAPPQLDAAMLAPK